MKTVSVSQASREFPDLIQRLSSHREDILVMEGGIAVARLSPVDDACEGRHLAQKWLDIRHLDLEEAELFAADLEASRRDLPPAASKWH